MRARTVAPPTFIVTSAPSSSVLTAAHRAGQGIADAQALHRLHGEDDIARQHLQPHPVADHGIPEADLQRAGADGKLGTAAGRDPPA